MSYESILKFIKNGNPSEWIKSIKNFEILTQKEIDSKILNKEIVTWADKNFQGELEWDRIKVN